MCRWFPPCVLFDAGAPIEQGAPADLFISADQQWMDYAIDKQQMVKDTRYTLLGNELVLIAAKSDKQDKIAIDKQTD